MLYLKADTITEVTIGPAVAVGDGFTPITTLTIAGADEAHLMKHNNTTAVALAGTLAVFSTPAVDGYYNLDLSATETDTEGRLVIIINDDSLILPIRHEFMVVNANVFDSMFAVAGTDLLQVDQTEIVGTTVPAPATAGIPDVNVREWLDNGVAAASAGVPDVNTTAFLNVAVAAATASGEVASNVTEWLGTAVTAATAGVPDTNAVRWNNGLIPAQGVTGVPEVDVTHFVATLAPTPATTGVPDVNTVEFLDTAVVLSNGLPDVNTENWLGTIATAATAGRPDVNAAALDDNTNAAAVLSDMLQDGVIGTADSGSTTSITDAARTEADDRWNGSMIVITSGLSAGQARLITEFANTGGVITFAPAVTTSLTTETYVIIPQAGVDVQSWLGTESALVAPNALVGGAVDADVSALQANVITAASINAAALNGKGDWNLGKTGYSLTQTFPTNFADLAITVSDGFVTLAGVTHTGAVIPTVSTLTGHTAQSGDSFTRLGAPAAASIAADLLAIDNFVDGLETTIGVAGVGLSDLGGMSTAMQAEVNTEVDTALDTALVEITQGVPSATPSLRAALMLMYMALRNKLDVATSGTDTLEIHNDAGTRITQKLLTDDGADYSEAKMITGV